MKSGGRLPPPTVEQQRYFFFFLAFFFIERLTPFPGESRRRITLLALLLLRRLLLHQITSLRDRSVTHRFAPHVLGLLGPAALVVDEVRVELRQAHNLEPALLERAVQHARVVRLENVERAVGLGRRAQAEALRERRGLAIEIAVDGR